MNVSCSFERCVAHDQYQVCFLRRCNSVTTNFLHLHYFSHGFSVLITFDNVVERLYPTTRYGELLMSWPSNNKRYIYIAVTQLLLINWFFAKITRSSNVVHDLFKFGLLRVANIAQSILNSTSYLWNLKRENRSTFTMLYSRFFYNELEASLIFWY